jgi:hypothetical protein
MHAVGDFRLATARKKLGSLVELFAKVGDGMKG